MKKAISLLLLSLLLPLTIFGLANAYDNSKYRFSVTAPTDWITSEGSNNKMTGVTFHTPENQTSADINVYVVHEKMNGLTINDIFDNSSAISSYLEKFSNNYTL